MGEDDDELRVALTDRFARQLLVNRICIGVEEADGDGLNPLLDQLLHTVEHFGGIEWPIDRPINPDPLRHLGAAPPRD